MLKLEAVIMKVGAIVGGIGYLYLVFKTVRANKKKIGALEDRRKAREVRLMRDLRGRK